jgi:excisionase family DNA binding protein
MPKTSNEKLMTVPEVASRLRLTEATVRNLVREGRIPFLRLGRNITRFRWERVREAMEERAARNK